MSRDWRPEDLLPTDSADLQLEDGTGWRSRNSAARRRTLASSSANMLDKHKKKCDYIRKSVSEKKTLVHKQSRQLTKNGRIVNGGLVNVEPIQKRLHQISRQRRWVAARRRSSGGVRLFLHGKSRKIIGNTK